MSVILLQNEIDAIPLVRPSMRGIALVECSLDMPVRDDDPGVTYADVTTPTAPDQYDRLLVREAMEALDRVLARRTARQRRVIRARLLDEVTLEEAGDMIGISRERVRQLEAETVAELRVEMGSTAKGGRARPPHSRGVRSGCCAMCGDPIGDDRHSRCARCRAIVRAADRARVQRRREAGLCQCGRPREDTRLALCRQCRMASARYRARKAAR